MDKTYTKAAYTIFSFFLLLFSAMVAHAQTVTIRSVDAGPYAPGSSITALITVNDDNGNITLTGNSYDLYLSDANGDFATEQRIGSFSGYYTGFVNGTIPNTIPAGTGYRVRVKTTSPVTVSAPSNPFSIGTGTGVQAATSSAEVNPAFPGVFGTCFGKDNISFIFENESSNNAPATVSFFNDLTQAYEGTGESLSSSVTFTAKASNYTVFVKAIENGIVGTKAYLLLNNPISNSFQTQNSSTVCLPENQKATVSYSVNITGLGGIQTNYPGTTYTISWGDGTSTNLTYFQIKATNGMLTHDYAISSCGARNAQGQVTNMFQVSFKVSPPYCLDQSKTLSGDQAVLSPPKNIISGPAVACTGKAVTFTNASYAGQVVSPGAGSTTCENVNATYQWYVNGSPVGRSNVRRGDPFVYTFPTAGNYTVSLKLTSTTSSFCTTPDASFPICINDAPRPAFTIPAARCLDQGPVVPTDQSVVTNNCNASIIYTWAVTPSTGVSYAGGTNANSKVPQFVFSNTGKYDVVLEINNGTCEPVSTPAQTILINDVPTAVLSGNYSICGNNKTIVFDNTEGSATKTTLTGTAQPQPNSFQWTVTPVGNLAPATFVDGTRANSQYPHINFPDYGTYEVRVTHTNDCRSVTSNTQSITFLRAPSVNAGADQRICQSDNTVSLNGSVSDSYVSVHWTTSGTGTFSDANILNPSYTPSAADKAAGEVRLTLTVTTNLPGECRIIPDEVIVNINPLNTITSPASKIICTTDAVNYTPTSTVAGSTFSWTAAASSNVSGFTASGTGPINDALTATSANADGTVTYRIVPRANGCDGTPFNLTVTVRPKPALTKPADKAICSGTAANITLTGNTSNIQYTWTSTVVTGDVSGTTTRTIPAAVTSINDVLVNNGNTAAIVTYTITPISANTANGCGGTPQSVTITVQPTTPQAQAGADVTLCSQPTYQLQGNNPAPFTGRWTGPAGITFADATQYNTTVSGLQPGQTYTLRWTITGSVPCDPSFDEITIINNKPIDNNTISLADQTTCAGETITITGSTPTGGSGTFTYQWETSTDNVNWTPLSNRTTKDLTVQISQSTYYRRSVNSGACTDNKSNSIHVIAQPGISGNAITGSPNTCINTSAGQITGSTPTGADGNFTYKWQSSTDGGAHWADITGATGLSYTTPVLTVTTQYRRIVSSLVCTGMQSNTSNVLTVVVNPDAKAEFTATTHTGCVPFVLTSQIVKAVEYPDRNGVYTWYANGQPIGTGAMFPGYTINAPGQSVQISLKVTSQFGCQIAETAPQTFTTTDQFTLDFKTDQQVVNNTITVCGTTPITFTNTSTPLSNASYQWNFGGAAPATSTVAQPGTITFAADPSGYDKEYTVTLSATPTCGIAEPKSIKIIVTQSRPLPIIDATAKSGCGTLVTYVVNRTKGTNKEYFIYVENAATGQRVKTYPAFTDPGTQQKVELDQEGDYRIYMVATSLCGTSATSSPVPVKVSPAKLTSILQVASGQKTQDCLPFTVTFDNLSVGATSYWYDWGDGTRSEVFYTSGNSTPPSASHQYTGVGPFYPKVHASDDCTLDMVSTDNIRIVGFELPKPTFNTLNSESQDCYTCTTVRFTNGTPDPNGNLTYTWDFGDGSSLSTEKNPVHNYDYNKGSSYTVKLTVTNINGCSATVSKSVTIIEPNTALYLPNAFMPNGNSIELRTFMAKGSGMKSWRMRVFNNYGQLIWETDKLDSRGAPVDGWDGTFRGTPVPQGVYIWQIEASFINGLEWKGMSYNNSAPRRTGAIHLIR